MARADYEFILRVVCSDIAESTVLALKDHVAPSDEISPMRLAAEPKELAAPFGALGFDSERPAQALPSCDVAVVDDVDKGVGIEVDRTALSPDEAARLQQRWPAKRWFRSIVIDQDFFLEGKRILIDYIA